MERDFNLYCGDSTFKEIFCKKYITSSQTFKGQNVTLFLRTSLAYDAYYKKIEFWFVLGSHTKTTAWWWYARCVEYASRILSFSLSFSSIIFWIMGWCFSNSSSPLLALLLCLLVLLLTKKKCTYNRPIAREIYQHSLNRIPSTRHLFGYLKYMTKNSRHVVVVSSPMR